jgi:phosphohistidine phosphatase SixA
MADNRTWARSWAFYCLVLVLVVIVVIGWFCWFQPMTTVLLVRHAEKSATPPQDPPLNTTGEARAQTLVHIAGDTGVTAVYATQFLRTQQTVKPLANHLGLPIIQVNATEVEGLVDQVLSDYGGAIVLIAGHGNTVPQIVEELRADSLCPDMFELNPANECHIPGDQYDNLFIVTVPRFGKAKVVRLKYGNPTP